MNIEIFPTENKPKDKKYDKLKILYSWIPIPPFRIVVIGCTGSGKSSMVYSLVKTYQQKEYFNYIKIYNKSIDAVDGWSSLSTKNSTITIQSNFDNNELKMLLKNIEQIQEEQKEKKRKPIKTLIIFDDMIGDDISKTTKMNAIDEVFMRGRHLNISVIIVSQSYKKLNRSMRNLNLSHLIVCRVNPSDLSMISEEHQTDIVPQDTIKEIYSQIMKNKYQFLVVDYSDNIENRFKQNFSKLKIYSN